MKATKSRSMTAPNQKNPMLWMPSFSSKAATRSAASAFFLGSEPFDPESPGTEPDGDDGGHEHVGDGFDEESDETDAGRRTDDDVGNGRDQSEQSSHVRQKSLDEQEAQELVVSPELVQRHGE